MKRLYLTIFGSGLVLLSTAISGIYIYYCQGKIDEARRYISVCERAIEKSEVEYNRASITSVLAMTFQKVISISKKEQLCRGVWDEAYARQMSEVAARIASAAGKDNDLATARTIEQATDKALSGDRAAELSGIILSLTNEIEPYQHEAKSNIAKAENKLSEYLSRRNIAYLISIFCQILGLLILILRDGVHRRRKYEFIWQRINSLKDGEKKNMTG